MTRPLLARRASSSPSSELVRSWSGAVMVRAASGSGERIIEGVAVPFGVVTTVRDAPDAPAYRETIERSAVDGLDPTSVLLDYLTDPPGTYNTHAGSRLVGRGLSADVGDDGLRMAFRVAQTAAGDELLELARAGVLTDMSVQFRPVAEVRRPDGAIARTAIDLHRVTVVPRGAYPGAAITAVRAASEGSNVHCQHCGAALVAGVGHSCPGIRAAAARAGAAPANPPADPPADDDAEDTGSTAATPAPAGDRPNRTRVTVDVERAIAEGIRTAIAALPNDDRARATAERTAVAGIARSAGRSPAVVTRDEFLYGPGSGRSFFADAFRASALGGSDGEARGRVERHYRLLEDVDRQIQRAIGFRQDSLSRAGDVLSSEIPGAYPNEYLPGLIVNRVLKFRPMGGFYDRYPIEDGRPRIYPVVSTSTSVAAQGAEGSNPAASDFATTGTTVTPTFYGGETKVSRQVLDGADPSTDDMIQSDLNESYMQASEAVIRAAVEAGSTASGVTLTAATPNVGLINLELNYLQNVFLPVQRVFLPTTLYGSWLTQLDTTNRPLAAWSGDAASVGSVTEPGYAGASLVGVPVVQSWSSTAGAGAGVGGVAVAGRSSDFAIFESNVSHFRFDQGAEAPAAIRIGLWAYLVVGTRRGSRKATGA